MAEIYGSVDDLYPPNPVDDLPPLESCTLTFVIQFHSHDNGEKVGVLSQFTFIHCNVKIKILEQTTEYIPVQEVVN